ncbi:magnesium and cobalt transport protein CorA [Parasphingorhabdus pacifica]
MVLIDSAIYDEGQRQHVPENLDQTFTQLRAETARKGRFAWIGLYRPNPAELESVAEKFDLHHLAVEDAVLAHQRPKLERYGETLFVVLRPARYVDTTESIEIGEVHVFVGPDFLITVRHAEEPDLAQVRTRLEDERELLRHGPETVLYALLDRVVDDYLPVVEGLQKDLDEIETEVFGGEPTVSRRIYQLSREVIEFQRASRPLLGVLEALEDGFDTYDVDVELRHNLRDVRDHAAHVADRVDSFRQLLPNILTVHSSLVAQRQTEETTRLSETSLAQNEDVKRISSWAAILFTPTLVGTVYGMNFTTMPELDWKFGYPLSLVLMGLVAALLYTVFKWRDWL